MKERSPGHWHFRLTHGTDAQGRQIQSSHTVRGTKKEAEKERTRLKHLRNTQQLALPSKQTLGDWLTVWLREYHTPAVSRKTVHHTAGRIKHILPHLGAIRLDRLTPLDIQSFYNLLSTKGHSRSEGPLSPGSVRLFHATLNRALSQAVDLDILIKNPCKKAILPRNPHQPPAFLDTEGVVQLLTALKGEPLYLPALIAALTGLRRGEVLALRWQDVDLERGVLTVCQSIERTAGVITMKEPKNRTSRRGVLIDEMLVAPLREHKGQQSALRLRLGPLYQNNDLIVCTLDGKPLNPDWVSDRFPRLCVEKGLPRLRFHDLRHSHASSMLASGVSPKAIQERLGHSTYKMTMDTYAHVIPAMHREAVELFGNAMRKAMGE